MTAYLLIARIGGASGTRRQRGFESMARVQRAIDSWRTQGYSNFWIYGPPPAHHLTRPLLRQELDKSV